MMKLFGLSRATLAVGAVTLALALVALAPGGFGTALAQTTPGVPPPAPPATVTVTVVVNNETTTVVTTPGGLASIVLPPGSQITSISLDVVTSPSATSATADAALTAVLEFIESSGLTGAGSGTEVGYVFEIAFGGTVRTIGSGGPALVMDYRSLLMFGREAFQTTGPTVLAKPAVATLNVKPETLAQVGGDLSRLQVVFIDPVNKISEPVKMVASPGPGAISFEFTKKGSYAVIVRPIVTAAPTAGSVVTPAAGTGGAPAGAVVPRPANTGTGIPAEQSSRLMLPLLAAAVLGLGLAGGVALRTARRRA